MKLISWNVNGIRAILKKDFLTTISKVKADLYGLQEIKISQATILENNFEFPGYQPSWHSAQRPGYSGTALLINNQSSLSQGVYRSGLGDLEFDSEGRVQILETKNFFFFNIYFPNANAELSRLDYKMRFNRVLLNYLKKLDQKKPVILSGDFNVAHQAIDLARPKENEGVAGFTQEERSWLDQLSAAGFIDSFRSLHPKKIQYSWWSFRSMARERNIGWRIDSFWLSKRLAPHLQKAFILDKVLGSDHAPVGIELDFK